MLLGSGQRYIAESALLLKSFRVAQTPTMGKYSLLETNNKYQTKLKPFGGVHRHHVYRLLRGVYEIGVRDERHILQKLLCAGGSLQRIISLSYRKKLLDVGPAILSLGCAIAHIRLISSYRKNAADKLGGLVFGQRHADRLHDALEWCDFGEFFFVERRCVSGIFVGNSFSYTSGWRVDNTF